jgi:tight adherence protein C
MNFTYNEVLICFCAAASLGCFEWTFYSAYKQMLRRAEINPERKIWIRSILFRILIPFAQPFGALFGLHAEKLERREMETGQKAVFLSIRKKLRKALIAAGSPEGITPDEFFGILVVTTGLAAAAGAICCGLLGWRGYAAIGAAAWILLAMVGLFFPLLWLRDKLKARKLLITKALPYSLDLLTLSVESGMDFTAALARIIQKLGGQPLSFEFAELLRQIRMGRTRADALRDLADRVDVHELTSVVSSLIQADELGSSLGPVLRIQAEQLRVRRSQRAEKLASEAPVKMLFPLVCFIFPTIFLMIGGTLFLRWWYNIQ